MKNLKLFSFVVFMYSATSFSSFCENACFLKSRLIFDLPFQYENCRFTINEGEEFSIRTKAHISNYGYSWKAKDLCQLTMDSKEGTVLIASDTKDLNEQGLELIQTWDFKAEKSGEYALIMNYMLKKIKINIVVIPKKQSFDFILNTGRYQSFLSTTIENQLDKFLRRISKIPQDYRNIPEIGDLSISDILAMTIGLANELINCYKADSEELSTLTTNDMCKLVSAFSQKYKYDSFSEQERQLETAIKKIIEIIEKEHANGSLYEPGAWSWCNSGPWLQRSLATCIEDCMSPLQGFLPALFIFIRKYNLNTEVERIRTFRDLFHNYFQHTQRVPLIPKQSH